MSERELHRVNLRLAEIINERGMLLRQAEQSVRQNQKEEAWALMKRYTFLSDEQSRLRERRAELGEHVYGA